jgi:hypothetical protein
MERIEVMDPVPSKFKVIQEGEHESSTQAYSYAKMALSDMHEGEAWTLAERLDQAMKQIAEQYIEEIRRDG